MSETKRVLIVGGGIAGMALAILLQRTGIAADIAEIDKNWRVYGAGITITGPTLRALDRLGLLDAVVNEGYCYDATRICDVAGNVILASRVNGRPLGPRIPNGGGQSIVTSSGKRFEAASISSASARSIDIRA